MSFFGRYKAFRYEAQLLAGLNADNFTNTGWIHKGHKSPMEYDVANKYGAAARLDYYALPGLRIGLSGYYGQSIGNSYPRNANGTDAEYKGTVAVGALDFTYNRHNWIVRGQADYGYLGDAEQLKYVYNRVNKKSPFHHSAFVSKNAYAVGIEAGYDLFSQIESMRSQDKRLYVFGRYEQYKGITGADVPVIEFLESRGEVQKYLENVYGLVDPAVNNYVERGFSNLMVAFGCTGGQHRSLYCANHLAAHLKDKFGDRIRIVLEHREQKIRTEL